jgi:F-type H+-transporting ATPase subunit gamma
MIKDLSLEYNKLRQASITNELLEITTAKMALE